MWSPLVWIHLFQPPSMVCISIIITQLHVTIHYRPLCAASMYCLYTPLLFFVRHPLPGYKLGTPTMNLECTDALDRLAMIVG